MAPIAHVGPIGEKHAASSQHRAAPGIRPSVASQGAVLQIEAADYYACLHVGNRTHMLRHLAELEQEFSESLFCRIHRSAIVNLDRVRGLELNQDGEYEVLLERGIRLRLSRRYRQQLESRMDVLNSRRP